jgi:hypothetical protein
MTTTLFSIAGTAYMLAFSPVTYAGCSASLSGQIASAERVVESLRPDKAGQMRVYAFDGSEFTAGQAYWMKGQLRGIQRACARGDDVTAAATLRGVQEVLDAHRKA